MNQTPPRVTILGIGGDGPAGLTARSRELLASADVVAGSETALALVGTVPGERVRVGGDPNELVELVRSAEGRRVVIVAVGDPLFYGVARYLCDRLGPDRFEVVPHVSLMQLAFARIKETWEDAYLSDLSTRPFESVFDKLRAAETVGLFTSDEYPPDRVARELLARGVDSYTAWVCENLGGRDERVTRGELADVAGMAFDPLNVVILKRKPGRPAEARRAAAFARFGNPDDAFAQSQPKSGLITQAEVRAIALAQLNVRPGAVVWDVGAGSGSVAVEAAQLAEPGLVYAIEQEAADYHLILANAETYGVRNVKAVHGTAPAVFRGLPAPDAVFVGHTGMGVAALLDAAYAALRPGGRVVVNVATMEGLSAVYDALKRLAAPVDVRLVQVARGVEQMETLRFEAVNPTFLLGVRKA